MKINTATTNYLIPSPKAGKIGEAAGKIARQTQTEQDKLMKLYELTNGADAKTATAALKKMGFAGVKNNDDVEGHLRQLINTQQQKVNRSFETLTAFQTFMKNIHEMIMAMIRNMRLQP